MRYFALVPMALLVACAETAVEEVAMEEADMAGVPIVEEADFLAQVAGNEMALEGSPQNTVTINADGTLTGFFGGADLAGTWEWRDGAWCRELSAGPRGPAPEDCQVWVARDGAFDVTRDRGAGGSFTYVLAGS